MVQTVRQQRFYKAGKVLYRVCTVAVCILCFVLLCWDQVTNYVAGETSVAQAFERKDNRTFPQIVICPKLPFRVKVAKQSKILYDRQAYLNEVNNVTIRFMGKVYTDYVFYKEKNFTGWDLFTYYQGICKVFNIDMEFDMNEHIAFIVDQDVLFLFMEPGEEFHLRTVEFLNRVSIVEVTSSAVIKLQPNTYKRLDNKDSNCRDYTVKQFNQCIIDLFLGEVGQDNVCSDVTSEPYFPGIEFCQPYNLSTVVEEKTREELESSRGNGTAMNKFHATSVGYSYLGRAFKGEAGDCVRPCDSHTYELANVPLLHMDEESLGGRVIYLGFSSMHDVVSSEYLIYNFGGIVAAMGGAIGLFLGVSVLQLFSWGFEKMYRHMLRYHSVKPPSQVFIAYKN